MYGRTKIHQPPMPIEEQVEKLNDISYFRLIKAYSLNLKPRNGNYYTGVTFEHIVELYLLNSNFRQLIFPEIEKVEINVRCRISNFFALDIHISKAGWRALRMSEIYVHIMGVYIMQN